MTEVEKVRKNWKKDTRKKYKNLMSLAKSKIKYATDNYCYIKRYCDRDEYFALWIIAKKLVAKGFKCELEKENRFNIFYYDVLTISWE